MYRKTRPLKEVWALNRGLLINLRTRDSPRAWHTVSFQKKKKKKKERLLDRVFFCCCFFPFRYAYFYEHPLYYRIYNIRSLWKEKSSGNFFINASSRLTCMRHACIMVIIVGTTNESRRVSNTFTYEIQNICNLYITRRQKPRFM